MKAHDLATDLDQHARACWREAEAHVSVRTVAELNRRRITAVSRVDGTHRDAGRWFVSPWVATACAGVCAIAMSLGLLWPRPFSPAVPAPPAVEVLDTTDVFGLADAIDVLDALDTLDAINLAMLDEDSEFFVWFATHEASLLAME